LASDTLAAIRSRPVITSSAQPLEGKHFGAEMMSAAAARGAPYEIAEGGHVDDRADRVSAVRLPSRRPGAFPGSELLGRPTSDSVTQNVVASTAIEAYVEYGLEPGVYTGATAVTSAPANEPLVLVIDGLASDTRYYYRLLYWTGGTGSWIARDEHSFLDLRELLAGAW
jgi:hypothetical protein